MDKIKPNFENNLKNYLLIVFSISFIIFSLLLVNVFVLKLGQPIKNVNYGVILQKNINEKNLSLPFPNLENSLEIGSGNFDTQTTIYFKYFNKDFVEFQKVIKKKYIYSENVYDCKYWAYVWTLYWKENKNKYNWKLDYITTENHIFVMVSNSSGYCLLDGDDINCLYG